MNPEEIKLKFSHDLFQKRMIYLEGDIDNKMANIIGCMIVWLNAHDSKEKITIYINSSGGSVWAGFDIYDIIKHSQAPVTGIVYRVVGSMAIAVLQACKKRKALEHSIFSFHNLRQNLHAEWDEFEKKMNQALDDVKKDQLNYNRIIAERIGAEMAKVEQFCKEKKILSAQEARDIGLIDEII